MNFHYKDQNKEFIDKEDVILISKCLPRYSQINQLAMILARLSIKQIDH